MKSSLLIALLCISTAYALSGQFDFTGNIVDDGSGEKIRNFLDKFHKIIRSGHREEIAAQLTDQAEMTPCEKKDPNRNDMDNYVRYNRKMFTDFLLSHGSNFSMELISSESYKESKTSYILTHVLVKRMGKPFISPSMFVVLEDRILLAGAEYPYCDIERPKEKIGDGSMNVVYDFVTSFVEAMKNRKNVTRVAEHFSDRFLMKLEKDHGSCDEYRKAAMIGNLTTLTPRRPVLRIMLPQDGSNFFKRGKDTFIHFNAAIYSIPPFFDRYKNYTLVKEVDGKFRFEGNEYEC